MFLPALGCPYDAYLELLCCPFSKAVFSKAICHRKMSKAAGEVCLLLDMDTGGWAGRSEGSSLPSQSSGSPPSLGLVLSPHL